MEQKIRFIKDSIGETLLITLYMKCQETRKPNPIIKDSTACILVDRIDYDFSKFKGSIKSSVGVAIRANYFDQVLKSYILRTQDPIIVIIGCGLDSRYERIGELSKRAQFYQLDIPEVIQIRNQLIPPSSNEKYISASMLETQWVHELKEKHPTGKFLFIVEGVFMYFSKESVQTVFQNLAENFSDSEILFDIVNVWMSKNSHMHDAVKFTNASFKYGTDDDAEMEAWAANLKLISSKLYTDFDTWKRAGIKGWLIRIIPKFKKAGRMLHYRIE
jgi:methyltransferase (TIGR00027 family)